MNLFFLNPMYLTVINRQTTEIKGICKLCSDKGRVRVLKIHKYLQLSSTKAK